MQTTGKIKRRPTGRERRLRRRLARETLRMPVIGMESEFNVCLDDVVIDPETYWRHPRAFIDAPMLYRDRTSSHIPTGGAVYFDHAVLEVVTPVIEVAPEAPARMVRSLWEQIQFVHDQLANFERKTGHTVRLQGYSSHYNVTYETPESEQTASRNEKALALLLAHILPAPMILVAANRRSTGIGVRPRGGRIEVTADFTPDAEMTNAVAALVVGIVRDVISWPSYELSLLGELPIPVIDAVTPGKHVSPTREGWVTSASHYPQNPFTSDIDAPAWMTQFGDRRSLRQIGRDTACYFRDSIRRFSDPSAFRLLMAVLEGSATSMLELDDRPNAYEDVGRLCRWSPDHRLARSEYEKVFLKLVSGERLRIGNDLYTPIGVKGWYHAILRRETDSKEKLMTIDQLLRKINQWTK